MSTDLPTFEVPDPTRFQMFSERGNEAVAALVRTVIEAAAYCSLTREQTVQLLQELIFRMTFVHREIHDTEPECAIVDAVNAGLMGLGLGQITRDYL